MREAPIDITARGAVILGKDVVCDGFIHDIPYRVQTHIHSDHMSGFWSSKGYQEIITSPATKDLLCALHNADLPYRSNIYSLEERMEILVGNSKLKLLPSGHMLGSVQVQVELASGMRVGYSGDFQWPLESVIEVDALVVDSTYGSPSKRRNYTQRHVDERFVELVLEKVALGPVVLYGDYGVVERALLLLDGVVCWPVVSSKRCVDQIEVSRRYGRVGADVLSVESPAGRLAMSEGRFLRLVLKGERLMVSDGTVLTLSGYVSDPNDPVLEYSERSYRIAMSNHADFEGTLEYVRATGARYVVTDNCRGPYGVELAMEINRRLGITARPSSNVYSRAWGA